MHGKHFGSELEYLLLCDFISKTKLRTVAFLRVLSQFSTVWGFGWGFFQFWKAVLWGLPEGM